MSNVPEAIAALILALILVIGLCSMLSWIALYLTTDLGPQIQSHYYTGVTYAETNQNQE